MIPTAKSDDPKNYRQALEVAKSNLLQKDPENIVRNTGVNWDGKKYEVKSFNDILNVYPEEAKVLLASKGELVVFQLQLITINYLARADGEKLAYDVVTYRELPGAESYWLAFKREALDPLLESYEKDKEKFKEKCLKLGGIKQEGKGDFNIVFWAFPRVPVIVKLWEGDEEIPGNCNILFDKMTSHYLHTEDVAALGQLISEIIYK